MTLFKTPIYLSIVFTKHFIRKANVMFVWVQIPDLVIYQLEQQWLRQWLKSADSVLSELRHYDNYCRVRTFLCCCVQTVNVIHDLREGSWRQKLVSSSSLNHLFVSNPLRLSLPGAAYWEYLSGLQFLRAVGGLYCKVLNSIAMYCKVLQRTMDYGRSKA